MKNTILTRFIKELDIKHTVSFSDNLYRIHPYRYSLYGLSKMLSVYQIPNAGIDVKDKNISSFVPPFIAHIANDFVIVKKVSEQEITYKWRGRELTIGYEDFKNIWSGVVLLAEPEKDSIEPEYSKHLYAEWFSRIQRGILLGIILITLFISCINFSKEENWGLIISVAISFAGACISYLLLMKQEKSHSEYADKICSLFHQKDCNNVLESPGAKIAGFTWSQIGLGYFTSNILLIITFPNLINYLAFINIMTLPYTIWSVWYQYKVVSQWCVLCLIVQAVVWVLFIADYIFGYISSPSFEMFHLLLIAMIYIFPVLLINILSEIIGKANRLEIVTQEFKSLKGQDEIFEALLKKESHYPVSKNTSQIIFGNPTANIEITILTNPHCEPCANMHKRVVDILKDAGDKLCVQYIFSSFSDELLISTRFLIATYLQKEINEAKQIYTYWYKKGKNDYKSYIQTFSYRLDSHEIDIELQKHEQWKKQHQLMATPTILINGYKLPDRYKIEDIKDFVNLNIN